jgi:hypothetical protein
MILTVVAIANYKMGQLPNNVREGVLAEIESHLKGYGFSNIETHTVESNEDETTLVVEEVKEEK